MASMSDLVRRMAAAGAPPEAIAIALEAVEDARGEIEARRAAERERKARQRDRSRDNPVTVTGQSQDSHGPVPGQPSSEEKRKVSPCTPSKEKTQPPPDLHSLPAEAHDHPKNARGRTLPEDWAPSDKHRAEAEKLGRNPEWLERVAEDMRLWAIGNSNRSVAKKANWDATFLGWMRREHQKAPPPQSRAPPWAPPDNRSAIERAKAAIAAGGGS